MKAVVLSVFIGLLLLTLGFPVSATGDKIKFCALDYAPPMYLEPRGGNTAGHEGFEIDFARRIAATIRRAAEFVRVNNGELEQALADGKCDVILGALAKEGTMAGPPLENVLLTRPYYAAAYQILHRPDVPTLSTLEDAVEERIAVESQSIVTYTLRQRGQKVQVLYDASDVIEALALGEVKYGYLWGPLAGWRLRGRRDVVLSEEFVPSQHWNFALAVGENHFSLYEELDTAVAELVASGFVRELFNQYSIPYLDMKGL